MPKLLIHNDYGNWYASIANTPVSYKFLGVDGEAQIVSVRALQNAMTEGSAEVVLGAPKFFDQVDSENAYEVVTQLFGTTNELTFEGTFVFETESSLFDEIIEAGEALGGFV